MGPLRRWSIKQKWIRNRYDANKFGRAQDPLLLHPGFLYGYCSLRIYGRTLCIYMFDVHERVYL